MRRLMIWIPVYGLVAIVLPRHAGFERLVEPLLRVPPGIVMAIVGPSLIASVVLIWLFRREPDGWMFRYPGWHMPILFAGLIGIAFSSALDVLDYLSGGAPNLVYLFLIPLAFMVAEAVAGAIERRLTEGPLGAMETDEPRGFERHELDEELRRAQAGAGTSFLSESRARAFLEHARSKGVVITVLEVWHVEGDSARLRPDLSVTRKDVKMLPAELTNDLISARLNKAFSEAREHVFVLAT